MLYFPLSKWSHNKSCDLDCAEIRRCYTNHALDQFLEHLINTGIRKIIRIGGQSLDIRRGIECAGMGGIYLQHEAQRAASRLRVLETSRQFRLYSQPSPLGALIICLIWRGWLT